MKKRNSARNYLLMALLIGGIIMTDGSASVNAQSDGGYIGSGVGRDGGYLGSGNRDGGGTIGSGTRTEDGGGTIGRGTLAADGGMLGSGTITEDGGLLGSGGGAEFSRFPVWEFFF